MNSKRSHIKRGKCSPPPALEVVQVPPQQSAATVTGNANTVAVNSHNVNNNTFNFYGTEELSHILGNPKRMDGYVGRCYMAIPALIRDAHYDPKHPENHTLRLNNVRDKFMQVRSDKGWITKMFKEVIDNLIDKYGCELQEHLESEACAIKLAWVRTHFVKMMGECVEKAYDKKKRAELENEVMMVFRDGREAIKSVVQPQQPPPVAPEAAPEAAPVPAESGGASTSAATADELALLKQAMYALEQKNAELEQNVLELSYELDSVYADREQTEANI